MRHADWQRVLSTCDELTALIDGCNPGENHWALAQVHTLCARMRGPTKLLNAQLNRIEVAADTYFSARKWAAHAQGAEGVKNDIVQKDLSRIRDEALRRIWLQP